MVGHWLAPEPEAARTFEAIIRTFPGRVLTVTVLAPQKRALSFDSCLPPAPAKRARHDEPAPLVCAPAARRDGAAVFNHALRRQCDAAALGSVCALVSASDEIALMRAAKLCCPLVPSTEQELELAMDAHGCQVDLRTVGVGGSHRGEPAMMEGSEQSN